MNPPSPVAPLFSSTWPISEVQIAAASTSQWTVTRGAHLAAPPAGARQPGLDLFRAAERYAELCKIGEAMGVTPVVEMWGHSPNVRRLSEAVLVAMESGFPQACVLPDVFHFYKGGSDPRGVRLLGPDDGAQACGEFGPGRLREPDAIVAALLEPAA